MNRRFAIVLFGSVFSLAMAGGCQVILGFEEHHLAGEGGGGDGGTGPTTTANMTTNGGAPPDDFEPPVLVAQVESGEFRDVVADSGEVYVLGSDNLRMLDGSKLIPTVMGLQDPRYLALDDDNVYFSEQISGGFGSVSEVDRADLSPLPHTSVNRTGKIRGIGFGPEGIAASFGDIVYRNNAKMGDAEGEITALTGHNDNGYYWVDSAGKLARNENGDEVGPGQPVPPGKQAADFIANVSGPLDIAVNDSVVVYATASQIGTVGAHTNDVSSPHVLTEEAHYGNGLSVDDEHAYWGASTGGIGAIRLSDGGLQFITDGFGPDDFVTATASDRGTVYVVTSSGKLFAIKEKK